MSADPPVPELSLFAGALVAVFGAGELAARLGLPRITGHLLAGVALGPQVAGVLRPESLPRGPELVALGVIGLAAGLALDLRAARATLRPLLAVVLSSAVLVPLAAGSALLLVARGLAPGADPTVQAVLALVVGALALASSPAAALALAQQARAPAGVTDRLLAVAAARDALAVLAVLGAVAGGRALLGAGPLDRAALADPALLAPAVLLGAALLGALARLGPGGGALVGPLARAAAPAHVVLFALAGAALDVRGALPALPVALAIAGARALATALAGSAARDGIAGPLWLAWLPQAGTTVALAALAAGHLPAIAGPLGRIAAATLALDLLLGPIAGLLGLTRAAALPAPAVDREPEPAPEEPATSEPLLPALAELLDPALQRVEEAVGGFVATALAARADALVARAEALLHGEEGAAARARVRRLLEEPRPEGGLEPAAAELHERVARALAAVPWEVVVPLDPTVLAAPAGERAPARLRRLAARVGAGWARLRGGIPTRRVPAKAVLRIAFEPRLVEALATVCASSHRAEAEVLAIVRGAVQELRPADPAPAREVAERFRALAAEDLRAAVRLAAGEARARLAIAGGPALPARQLRLAEAEAEAAATLRRIHEDGPAWAERVGAAADTVRVALLVETLADAVATAVGKRVRRPLATAREALLSEHAEIAAALEAAAAPVAERPGDEALAEVVRRCEELASGRLVAALRRASERFRRATQPGPLVADLAEVTRHVPDRLWVVDRSTPVERAARPEDVVATELPLAKLATAIVENELLPAIGAAVAAAVELVAADEARVREAIGVARYGAELALRGGFETWEERREVLADGVERAARKVRQHQEQLAAAFDRAALGLEAAERDGTARLRALIAGDAGGATRVVRSVRSSLRSGLEAARRGWAVVLARTRDVEAAARRLSRQRAVRDLVIRSGHEPVDADGIRAYLDTFLPPAEARGVPTVYVRLMTPAPVTEPRLFVARTALLQELIAALADPEGTRAASTLVVGPDGAGKSSLLHLVKLQLVGPRVLWLDPAFASREAGPVGALATELGTPPVLDAVLDALARTPTVVLFDDLHGWLAPDRRGLDGLAALLRVIERARGTRWLVSLDDAAFALLEEARPLRQAFRRVIALPPLDWRELQALFDVRERLGGFDTRYGAGGRIGRWVERLRPGREKEHYFRALASASEGVPGTALQLHLDAVRVEGDALLVGPITRPALPFVDPLGEEVQALLAGLVRWGPTEPAALAALLGRAEEEVAARIGFLVHAGLVVPARIGGRVSLAPRLAGAVRRELAALAVLPRGAA